jgi:hypothetical protein
MAVSLSANPYVNEGEWKLTQTGSFAESPSGASTTRAEFEVFHGFTDDLGAGIQTAVQKKGAGSLEYRQAALSLKYQMTDAETSWWVTALQMSLSRADGAHKPIGARLSLLGQNDSFNMRHRSWVTLGRDFGAGRVADGTLSVRHWSRYNLFPAFAPGVEYAGDFGEIEGMKPFNEGKHYFGPMISGVFPWKTAGGKWNYELALLRGITPGADDTCVRWKLEVVF